ncbi:MAG TPA: putative glycoside hydrolase [Acidimicrobiia bacterium]|nr:putative glycoside hydrolase [Acidimicrobiia bacterium]
MRTIPQDRGGLEILDGPRRTRYRRRRRRNIAALFLKGAAFATGAIVIVGLWILVTSLISADAVELLIEDERTGQPVVGATVTNEGGRTVASDENGIAAIAFEAPQRLLVVASGYHPATFEVADIPRQSQLTLMVHPRVLQGRVVGPRGVGLFGATVTLGDRTAITGDFGSFELSAVEPGTLEVSKLAWETTEAYWDGDPGRFDVPIEPFVVRGLRVHAGADLDSIFNLIEGTVINTLVFDTKIEDGQVVYAMDHELASEFGALNPRYNVEDAIAESHRRGLYTITRVVTFQDYLAAPARPEWAILNSETGEVWRNVRGLAWLDPTNREAWEYPLSIAVEACRMGFDEVQFDYVRFPTDGDVAVTEYSIGSIPQEVRVQTISDFLAEARERLHAEGCAVSADIFGIVLSVPDDQGIGQRIEELSMTADALSGMVYPSHYGRGWLDLDNPNDHPYSVVAEALEAASLRNVGGTLMRPWLQAFSWSPAQVLESIRAAEENGGGWMLWNSLSRFHPESLPRDE